MNLPRVRRRRGIDPIVATLLLIAITVAAAIVVYVYVTGIAGTLTGGGGTQVTEQLSMDANIYSPIGRGVAVYLRNTGTASVTVDSAAIFFDGLKATDAAAGFSGTACGGAPAYTLSVGSVCYIALTTTPVTSACTPNGPESCTSGTSHSVKVVTKTGGTFVYTVIAGRSG